MNAKFLRINNVDCRQHRQGQGMGIQSNPFKWRMRKVAALLAAAAVTAIGGGVVTATSANAADGYVYVYEHNNYGGYRCRWNGDDGNYRYNSNGCGNWNDRVSSAWNNGYNNGYPDVLFFEHIGYRGHSVCLRNGYAWSNMGGWWNDRISSHKWVRC